MSILTEFRPRLAAPRPAEQTRAHAAMRAMAARLVWRAPVSRSRSEERRRWAASRVVALLGIAALISVLPTTLRGVMHGVFGGQGLVGPLTSATAVMFWSITLLLVARGLRHGHRIAWALTLTFIAVAVGLHLAWRDDPVETGLLCVGAGWLVSFRSAFGVLLSAEATVKARAVAGGVGCLVAAAFVVPRHFDGGVVHAVLLAAALVGLVGSCWVILSPRPAEQRSDPERHLERECAREVVACHGRGTLDYFALRDDKRWFFHGHSVVAYAVRFGVCLVSPDPIGPSEERATVWTAFMEYARARGWTVSILGADAQWIGLYRSFGLHPVYLGDEAVVDCATFNLDGRKMRSLRQACNRVDRAGYTVSFHDPDELDADRRRELLELATVSREGAVERGFSMTLSRLFDPDDKGLMLSITRDPQGHPRAFIQWIPAPGIDGWSLDVMRYDTGSGVPNGVMDHLIVQTIRHLAMGGEVGLALNFAVVRALVANDAANAATRFAQRLLPVVSGRTQIASLCHFNQKFYPDWQPRYVVLDSLDTMACQGLMIAAAEGLSDIPVIGRFMKGAIT